MYAIPPAVVRFKSGHERTLAKGLVTFVTNATKDLSAAITKARAGNGFTAGATDDALAILEAHRDSQSIVKALRHEAKAVKASLGVLRGNPSDEDHPLVQATIAAKNEADVLARVDSTLAAADLTEVERSLVEMRDALDHDLSAMNEKEASLSKARRRGFAKALANTKSLPTISEALHDGTDLLCWADMLPAHWPNLLPPGVVHFEKAADNDPWLAPQDPAREAFVFVNLVRQHLSKDIRAAKRKDAEAKQRVVHGVDQRIDQILKGQ